MALYMSLVLCRMIVNILIFKTGWIRELSDISDHVNSSDRGSVVFMVFFYLGIILLAIGLPCYARCTSFLSRSATAATGVAKRALITTVR